MIKLFKKEKCGFSMPSCSYCKPENSLIMGQYISLDVMLLNWNERQKIKLELCQYTQKINYHFGKKGSAGKVLAAVVYTYFCLLLLINPEIVSDFSWIKKLN